MHKILISLFLLINLTIQSQVYNLRGVVSDSSNNAPLSFANVRVVETQYGTTSNYDGEFRLRLKGGDYKLLISYVGFKSDTFFVKIPTSKTLSIKLLPKSIILPEVVVSDEDPALRIIREAIRRKELNRRGLENFEYDAYSRKIIKSVGEVALIEETFVKGYNKVGNWEKEFIKSVHKTENLKKEERTMDFNITNNHFVDFSRDTLSLFLNTVYLPLADNAFDFYDYRLLKTTVSGNIDIYEIKVIPRSNIQPLLEGIITIDSRDYALNSIRLSTNKGVRFPYINNLKAEFKQSLGKNSDYWLPLYVEYSASMELNIQGLLKIGEMEFSQLSNITNYIINAPIPDSVENAVRSKYGSFTPDTSENERKPTVLTRNDIDSLREIPLTQKEIVAFETLDSNMTIEKMVKVEGALAGLIPEGDNESDTTQGIFSKGIGYASEYLQFRNNRVTGLLFGLRYNDTIIGDRLGVSAAAGYSFQREEPEGQLKINYKIKDFALSNIFISYHNYSEMWQDFSPHADIINSLGITLGSNDQFNYYLSKGFGLGVESELSDKLSLRLDYNSESQSSIKYQKYKSLVSPKRTVRENPQILEGNENKLSLSLFLGHNPLEIQVIPENGLVARFDYSLKELSSDFNFRRLRVIGMIKSKTFFNELFVSPYIHVMLDAGILSGKYGPQHLLTPNTALAFYAPFGTLKGLKPYQYVGDKMITLQIEHNWRSIPFQSVGLDFMSDLHIDIITGVSGLKIWNDSNYLKELKMAENNYWEIYLGISRIFAVSRIDFSYTSIKKFQVTASIAVLL